MGRALRGHHGGGTARSADFPFRDTGRFELADGVANTLNVVTPAGVIPHGKYRIVTAGTVKGTFAALQYNGKSPVPYTVQYLPDGINVEFP